LIDENNLYFNFTYTLHKKPHSWLYFSDLMIYKHSI
jgi:hypothetical protein